jgi:uncharacterized BrkB/YihY/UPF0761 family membrane protein
MQTEVHVYAFSVAANVLLSFFPFLIVVVSLCRHVFRWKAAEAAIYLALTDYFPGAVGAFVKRNLEFTVDVRGPFQFFPIFLLLLTANGIFEPLEVALNRAWGIPRNRSYIRNQAVSLALIFGCGALALTSASLTALNQEFLSTTGLAQRWVSLLVFKMAAVPLSIVMLMIVYWLLPNGRVPFSRIAPVAVVIGLLIEVLKYVNLLTLPLLQAKLQREYGPFVNSVTIILWAFVGSMLVLAGAEWAARPVAAVAESASANRSLQSFMESR